MNISFLNTPEHALLSYQQNGFFLEENIFSHEECDELIKAGMSLSNVKQGDFRPRIQPHRENPLFLDVMKNPKLIRIMSYLIQAPIVGLQTEFFYGVPGVKGFANHQDNFYVEAPEECFASAWIALVDVDSNMGCLTGFPGSHREGRLNVKKINSSIIKNQDPNANREETIVPKIYSEVLITVPKGAVVFLHSHFVHGSRANVSSKNRYSLLCTYLTKDAVFRPGQYAKREPIDISNE